MLVAMGSSIIATESSDVQFFKTIVETISQSLSLSRCRRMVSEHLDVRRCCFVSSVAAAANEGSPFNGVFGSDETLSTMDLERLDRLVRHV